MLSGKWMLYVLACDVKRLFLTAALGSSFFDHGSWDAEYRLRKGCPAARVATAAFSHTKRYYYAYGLKAYKHSAASRAVAYAFSNALVSTFKTLS